jgi:hypothetical protein
VIRTLLSYLVQQVRPRSREIVTEPEALFSICIGVAAGVWANRVALGDSRVGDVLTVVPAYAAVAFGFCLAGMTLAMTLPDAQFVDRLAKRNEQPSTSWRKRRPNGFEENAYARLLFVFSWTAVLHWMAIATAFVMLTVRGFDATFLPRSACLGVRVLVGVLAFFLIYAAMQFLVTLVTLSQVGNAYISELRNRKTP